MQLQEPPVSAPHASPLPGAPIFARIRRLLITALLAVLGYSTFTHASSASCAGGTDGQGGFIDSGGNPIDYVPSCVQLTLGPSPVVYAAIAVIILVAVTRVLRRAESVDAALRALDRAAAAIGVIAVVSFLIAQVWFGLIPITTWSDTDSTVFIYPFPFGSVEMAVTPMTVS